MSLEPEKFLPKTTHYITESFGLIHLLICINYLLVPGIPQKVLFHFCPTSGWIISHSGAFASTKIIWPNKCAFSSLRQSYQWEGKKPSFKCEKKKKRSRKGRKKKLGCWARLQPQVECALLAHPSHTLPSLRTGIASDPGVSEAPHLAPCEDYCSRSAGTEGADRGGQSQSELEKEVKGFGPIRKGPALVGTCRRVHVACSWCWTWLEPGISSVAGQWPAP